MSKNLFLVANIIDNQLFLHPGTKSVVDKKISVKEAYILKGIVGRQFNFVCDIKQKIEKSVTYGC